MLQIASCRPAPAPTTVAVTGPLPALDADHPGQLRDVAQHLGHALEELDRGRALLDDVDRDLLDALALSLGADDELRGEQVAVDDAALDGVEERGAAEGLQPVGVGAVEADQH